MMLLGFFAGSVYVLLALRDVDKGGWPAFWMGSRARSAGGARLMDGEQG